MLSPPPASTREHSRVPLCALSRSVALGQCTASRQGYSRYSRGAGAAAAGLPGARVGSDARRQRARRNRLGRHHRGARVSVACRLLCRAGRCHICARTSHIRPEDCPTRTGKHTCSLARACGRCGVLPPRNTPVCAKRASPPGGLIQGAGGQRLHRKQTNKPTAQLLGCVGLGWGCHLVVQCTDGAVESVVPVARPQVPGARASRAPPPGGSAVRVSQPSYLQ